MRTRAQVTSKSPTRAVVTGQSPTLAHVVTGVAALEGTIKCDSDAADLIRVLQFDWQQLREWITKNWEKLHPDYVRQGGRTRLEAAIDVLKRNDHGYLGQAYNPFSEQVAMMLAKAGGVAEVAISSEGFPRWEFVGGGEIPFPHGTVIIARGIGDRIQYKYR